VNSRKILRSEGDGSSTTSVDYICFVFTTRLLILSVRCGLLFYPLQRQCEKPTNRVEQYSSYTYFLFMPNGGSREAIGDYENENF
jgi:hypothetical protein